MTRTQALSTRNMAKWPDTAKLKKLCQTLATLSWIQMDLERYFMSPTSAGAAVFQFSNGEGDSADIYFDDAGVLFKGFAHECIYAFAGAEDCPWPKEDGEWLPEEFRKYWAEHIDDEDLSFIAWYSNKDKKWANLDLKLEEREEIAEEDGDDDPNGSEEIWDYLPLAAEIYAEWEGPNYEKDFNVGAVKAIYNHEPLTKDLITKLNPDFDFEDTKHMDALKNISYPSKL